MTDSLNGGASWRLLLPHHRRTLEVDSKIDPAIIDRARLVSVTEKKDLEGSGSAARCGTRPTLAVPIHGVIPNEPPWYMHRPDETPIKEGKPRKYLIPAGRKMALDIHPRARPHLGDPQLAAVHHRGPEEGRRAR